MKCVLRVGSSQRSPQIMRAWGRMRNFIISKRMRGLMPGSDDDGTNGIVNIHISLHLQ